MSQKRSQSNRLTPRLFACLKLAELLPGRRHRAVQRGYTIIEVMIFMAVTGAMFTIVMRTFSGQQGRAEFNTAIREVESKFQDIINNVGSGLYTYNSKVKCLLDGTPTNDIKFEEDMTGVQQGTNNPCIYIGQMIHFAPDGNRSAFSVYSAAGKRVDSAGKEIGSIAEARPLLIAKGQTPQTNRDGPEAIDVYNIPPGIKIAKVSYNETGTWVNTGSMGFFTTFGKYNSNSLQSGSQTTDLVVIKSPPGPGLDAPKDIMVMQMVNGLRNPSDHVERPANGVKVCFEGDSTNQAAVFTISGNQFTSVKVDVYKDIATAVAAGEPC